MREILFKAKREDNGEWVEGYYRRIPCMGMLEHYIMPRNPKNRMEQYAIDPDTLCQYTGLTDKNGKKIWENDIVRFQFDNDDCPFPNKDTKKRLTTSVHSLAQSVEQLVKSQNRQESRLEELENRDGDTWRKVKWYLLTLAIGAVFGLLVAQIGL